MRRSLVLTGLTVLVVASLVLAGCGGKETPEATPAPESTGEVDTQQEVTLKIWDFGGVDFQWMDDIIIPEYQKTHPNVQFEHLGVPEDELGLKLETAIAAGDVPDLAVFVPSRLVKAGHILILNNLMDEAGLAIDDFCAMFRGRDMIEGEVFSLPITANFWGMIYNKALFREAGLKELGINDVITMQEWLEYARAINKPADNLEDRVWGSNLFFPSWNSMGNFMSNPFVLGPDGRKCQGNANTDDWYAAWQALKTAYEENLTTWSAGALLTDVEEDMFLQGKIGMTEATLGNAIAAREAGIEVGITGQPVITKGWDGNAGGWNVSYSILAGSKHPEAAFEFLKFLAVEAPVLLAGGAGGEASGVPCYLPLAEEFLKESGSDPLIKDAIALLDRMKPVPFNPDIWGSVAPFDEAWRLMTEEDADVKAAVDAATEECQEITDGLWEQWDSLSK